MNRSSLVIAFTASALLASIARESLAVTSTFDDLPLAPNSFYYPASDTPFTSGAARFNHDYSNFGATCCWEGWSYSNVTDQTTPGFTNQYSAYATPGGGGLSSANYGVAFVGLAAPVVSFDTPGTVAEAYFTNTTYAALSMLNGDPFAKKFGGASGSDPDFFKLTITGRTAAGAATGAVDFFLADYRFANNSQDYVVADWTFVDLSSLGTVSRLEFSLDSSDIGAFGINTPAYFAMDNLSITLVPEPSSAVLLLAGLAATLLIARRGIAQRRRRKR